MTDRSIAGRITNVFFESLRSVVIGGVIGGALYAAGDHAFKVLSAPDCADALKQDFTNAAAAGADRALITLKNGTYCKLDFTPS